MLTIVHMLIDECIHTRVYTYAMKTEIAYLLHTPISTSPCPAHANLSCAYETRLWRGERHSETPLQFRKSVLKTTFRRSEYARGSSLILRVSEFSM